MRSVHKRFLSRPCRRRVLVIGNEKRRLQRRPSPHKRLQKPSKRLSFANDLGPFLATNKFAIVFIKNVLGGRLPSESKQCEILSGAHENIPRAAQNKIQPPHAVSLRYGIYMTQNARDAKQAHKK